MDEWQQKFNDYFTGLQENGKQLKELREQQKEKGNGKRGEIITTIEICAW